jgi:hypothetical protein
MTPTDAAQDHLHQAVRVAFVAIAHEPAFSMAQLTEYVEEMAALFQTDPRKLGPWALTLQRQLGNGCPATVTQALEGLADAVAVLEALELD